MRAECGEGKAFEELSRDETKMHSSRATFPQTPTEYFGRVMPLDDTGKNKVGRTRMQISKPDRLAEVVAQEHWQIQELRKAIGKSHTT